MSTNGQGKAPVPHPLQDLPRPVYGHAESFPNQVVGYRHRHHWHQLAHAGLGAVQVHTDAAHFVVPPQRAVWIPAGIAHRITCEPGTQLRSLYVIPAMPGWDAARCRVITVEPLLRELIEAFAVLAPAYDQAGADGRLVQVLLDRLAQAPDVGLALPLPRDARLRRICRALQARPHGRQTLETLSAGLGVSGKTLSRLFLRDTGLTFRAWRQRMRLLQALPALQRGQSVTTVALDSGYDSVSAFIAAFRSQFGATPGAFLASAIT